MKKYKSILAFLVISLFLATFSLNAQTMAPSDPPGGPGTGSGGTPIGGNAPIGAGSIMLLSLGLAYGGKKLYEITSKDFHKE